MITWSRDLLRYDRSFIGPFSVLRVDSRNSLYMIKKLYGSNFSIIGNAVYHISQWVICIQKQENAYIVVLCCEDDNLIELREIRDEIVDSRAFCCAPTMLAL
jgi:hypothetical protein